MAEKDRVAVEVIRDCGFDGSPLWKRDRWYLSQTTDDRTWITRIPDKNIEGGHHTDTLPPWPIR
jgi:hypothetical protein